MNETLPMSLLWTWQRLDHRLLLLFGFKFLLDFSQLIQKELLFLFGEHRLEEFSQVNPRILLFLSFNLLGILLARLLVNTLLSLIPSIMHQYIFTLLIRIKAAQLSCIQTVHCWLDHTSFAWSYHVTRGLHPRGSSCLFKFFPLKPFLLLLCMLFNFGQIPSLFSLPMLLFLDAILLFLDAILLFLKAIQFFNYDLQSFFSNKSQLWIVQKVELIEGRVGGIPTLIRVLVFLFLDEEFNHLALNRLLAAIGEASMEVIDDLLLAFERAVHQLGQLNKSGFK